MMGKFNIRHLVGKKQAGGHTLWYWQPSATLRKLGFVTHRLAERTNRLEDAIVEAERFNRELDDWRAGKGSEKMLEPGTLPWLVKLYKETERYTDLKDSTQRAYNAAIARLLAWSEENQHPPIAGMTGKHARDFLKSIVKRGMQVLTYRVLRLLLAFAVEEGHATKNVATALRIKGTPARSTYWQPADVEAFVAKAREMGRDSLALAVLLAVNTGQREGDIIRLAWSNYDGDTFVLRQQKTGAKVSVPATADLRELLATVTRKAPTIVVSEQTHVPYKGASFRHHFGLIRSAAGLSGALRFHDLRRTAVVRLAEAGCTVPEISAVTGHSLDGTAQIIAVYLPPTAPMARAAVTRLDEARARTKGGAKLEGGGTK
jgi:integrase